LGIYDFDLQITDKTLKHLVHVIRNLHEDIILGIDFIHMHQLTYCPETQEFSWGA
jgi:hypothetical protein